MVTTESRVNGQHNQAVRRCRPVAISVTSGKGGVGKTVTVVNFALAARKMGLRVLILDGDLGLANVDVVLGLHARYNIRDVLDGHVSLRDIIVTGPMGINLAPSGSGIASLQQLTYVQKQCLAEQLHSVENDFDLLLIDTGAGISENVRHLNGSADRVVIVTTPEPHAMTDAYAMVKVMNEGPRKPDLNLIVNMARTSGEGQKVFERLATVAQRFIGCSINYLGFVPADAQVARSVLLRRAVSDETIHTMAGQAWNQIARELIGSVGKKQAESSGQTFWESLLWNEGNYERAQSAGCL